MNLTKFKPLIATIAVAMFLSSCSSNVYRDKAFFERNSLHGQSLAILPAEIQYRGNMPKTWSADRLAAQRNAHSLSLQQELYDDFLFHTSPGKQKSGVRLMDPKGINDMLAKAGVTIEESYDMPSSELLALVGTDMIIRPRVQSVRYMSEAAAAGINIGASVVEGLLERNNNNTVFIPRAKSGESDMDLTMYHSSRSEPVARITARHKLKVRKLPLYAGSR